MLKCRKYTGILRSYNFNINIYTLILKQQIYIETQKYTENILSQSVSGSTDKHTKLEIDLIEITKYIYI